MVQSPQYCQGLYHQDSENTSYYQFMSTTKTRRNKKRQLGQFLTPLECATQLVNDFEFQAGDTVLEPSVGDGSFVLALIEKFLPLYNGPLHQRLDTILNNNIFGLEIDQLMLDQCLARIEERWGYYPKKHNLILNDFFTYWFTADENIDPHSVTPPAQVRKFDYIIGNPPFGGTIELSIQDTLDRLFGIRDGIKIKKETYAFFIVKCTDILKPAGTLRFICSDTFLTIPTMRGLRRHLMQQGQITINTLETFSPETNHAMVVLDFMRQPSDQVQLNGRSVHHKIIEQTPNYSWRVTEDLAHYFVGPKLSDYIFATSGMTTGNNSYFLRPIVDNAISEPYQFEFFDDPITLAKELQHARLGYLSAKQQAKISKLEAAGATRRNVRIIERKTAVQYQLPHPDYRPYNKAQGSILYAQPTHMIYWKDNGDAVRTFKRNGNWYLHGVGGQRYFGREGITWQLIAQRLNMRYLPAGYIFDSGSPCAFIKPGHDPDELFFILAWSLSPLCERLLKGVINHTKNIQSKDFERLPYPFWVAAEQKQQIIRLIKNLVNQAQRGKQYTRKDPEIIALGTLFNDESVVQYT